ncbi:hypothetical protein [Streptomyces sp. YGL11-2]|uniref:hypothetical protein n=1 Tax=Streptomyces sp. YGL11-2 TaxID=3414028 RepID=UPI003CEE2BF4
MSNHRSAVRKRIPRPGLLVCGVAGTARYPPSRSLGRFAVDSVVFGERALRPLVDTLGADRVVVGSDYPSPRGERRPARWSAGTGSWTTSAGG